VWIYTAVKGVWVWKERLDATSELVNAVWHCQKKRTVKVVVLKIKYTTYEDELKNPRGDFVSITHWMTFDNKTQFFENAQASVLKDRVDISRIRFVRLYDLSPYIVLGSSRPEGLSLMPISPAGGVQC